MVGKSNKNNPKQQAQAGPDVVFRDCKLFNETAAQKFRENPGLAKKLIDFQEAKTKDKMAPFGANDKPFKSFGFFAGFRHAHLNSDLSLIYSIHGANPTVIDLYGIFSHDEIGTGQPANIKRQKAVSQQVRNQVFK